MCSEATRRFKEQNGKFRGRASGRQVRPQSDLVKVIRKRALPLSELSRLTAIHMQFLRYLKCSDMTFIYLASTSVISSFEPALSSLCNLPYYMPTVLMIVMAIAFTEAIFDMNEVVAQEVMRIAGFYSWPVSVV